MDSSLLVTTSHLFSDWMMCMLEDSEFEASLTHMRLLRKEGRSSVWEMCAWFGCRQYGIPGQACRLLERYLYSVLHNRVGNREDIRQSLLAESPILIASCIALSAKMSNAAIMLRPKVVKIILLCKNIKTTINEIITTEFKVFKTLDFCIPMWTSVDVGEMLAVKAGFPVKMLEGVAMVVDAAEFNRYLIDRQVKCAANGMEQLANSGISGVLSLHLTAGAVAAAARFGHYDEPEAVRLLAQLTKAPPLYIECIRDVICAEIFFTTPQSPILKAKKSGNKPQYKN